MRLTLEHIKRAPQFTNALHLRELDLRDLSLSMLDEAVLSLILQSFDVINLTSNALTVLEDFQSVTNFKDQKKNFDRTKILILHRNRLERVSSVTCVRVLPSVKSFFADYNNFKTIKSLMFIREWNKLEVISLEHNPVLTKNELNYSEQKIRAFLIYICPSLNMINWERVKESERTLSHSLHLEFQNVLKEFNEVKQLQIFENDEFQAQEKTRKRGKRTRKELDNSFEGETTVQNIKEAKKDMLCSTANKNLIVNMPIEQQLQEIEERLQADDISQEEIEQLEKRMNDLLEQQQKIEGR